MTATDAGTRRMGAAEWGLLLLLSALWGGSFFFFKVLAATLPPLTIVFGRVLIAALVLNLLLILRQARLPSDAARWRAFLVMGLLNNVIPFGLLIYGETRIASGLASILNATTPMFTIVAAHLFTADEKASPDRIVGVSIGVLGVAALAGPDLLRGSGGDLVGEGACLLAALSYGVAGVFGRRFRGLDPITVATGQLSASALIALPLCLALDHPWRLPAPTFGAWSALAGLAIPSTALAYLIFFRILQRAGATNVSLVTLLVPVSAVLLGVFVLEERLTMAAVAGMTLIGLGLAWIDGRPLRWMRPSRV